MSDYNALINRTKQKMSLENSASLQKIAEMNESNKILMKLAATQNVIKNKFSKAYANRLEHENNLIHTMETSFCIKHCYSILKMFPR